MLSAIGGGALEVAGFELVYVTAPGDGVRVGLADAWALRLESVPPVRRFASYRGQRHLSAAGGRPPMGAMSDSSRGWKRDHVLHLDFDPSVVGIASQPLWLHWTDEGGPSFCRTPLAEQVHRVSSHKPATGGAAQTSCHPVRNRGHQAFWIESVKLRTQR
jgi:hypothetical protein